MFGGKSHLKGSILSWVLDCFASCSHYVITQEVSCVIGTIVSHFQHNSWALILCWISSQTVAIFQLVTPHSEINTYSSLVLVVPFSEVFGSVLFPALWPLYKYAVKERTKWLVRADTVIMWLSHDLSYPSLYTMLLIGHSSPPLGSEISVKYWGWQRGLCTSFILKHAYTHTHTHTHLFHFS